MSVRNCFIDSQLFISILRTNNVCQKLFYRFTPILYRFFGQIMSDRNCFMDSQLFYFDSSDK